MTIAFAATLLILLIGWAGSALGLQYLLGVILPLVAGAVFIIGFIWKIVRWAKSPVPFAIPTVAGQQRSLDWIKPNRLECPWTTPAVVGRMILEVFAFRSLFRNTRAERTTIDGTPRITYFSNKWLWVFALLFHYSMLVIIIRHARFFLTRCPRALPSSNSWTGVFQVGRSPLLPHRRLHSRRSRLPAAAPRLHRKAPLHLAARRLLCAVSAHRHCRFRHLHALHLQGGHQSGEGSHHGPCHAAARGSSGIGSIFFIHVHGW